MLLSKRMDLLSMQIAFTWDSIRIILDMEEASVPIRMGRFMRGSGLKINHMEGVGLLRLLETSIWGI
jgi:hypothetical protein